MGAVAIIAALSLLAALSAPIVDNILPETSKDRFTAEATLPVLNILASGMLVVATFSLGVMVSSHRTLAINTTPRIHRLLMEDTSTQSMLATFIGAFVFSLSSIILFRAGYYSDGAAVAVFGATIFVVAAIVVSLVRWIYKLSRIGSIDYALERVDSTARETLESYRESPTFGARSMHAISEIPEDAGSVEAKESGFVLSIDVAALQGCAEDGDGQVFVEVLPGDRVLTGQRIARITGETDPDAVANDIHIGASRGHDQDPRYALQAMRETASKALSPGINDPGTAVEVVTRLEILLHDNLKDPDDPAGDLADRVFVRALSAGELINTAFRDIARDGASFVDVLSSISVALSTMDKLPQTGVGDCVARLRKELSQHAEQGLRTEAERDRFRELSKHDDKER